MGENGIEWGMKLFFLGLMFINCIQFICLFLFRNAVSSSCNLDPLGKPAHRFFKGGI